MNRMVMLLFLSLLALPLVGQAHTTLSSSTPAEGEVVGEALEEVELTFGTTIEQASTMTLESEGMTYEFEEITLSEKIMKGTISEELPNGAYVIRWNIIGADGHPIEGEVPFELDVEVPADKPAAEEEEPVEETPAAEEPEVSSVQDETEADEGSPWVTILIGAVLLAGLFGVYRMWKKK